MTDEQINLEVQRANARREELLIEIEDCLQGVRHKERDQGFWGFYVGE